MRISYGKTLESFMKHCSALTFTIFNTDKIIISYQARDY